LGEIRRLRWSYVARHYDQSSNTYVYSYVQRTGKIAGRVIETLIEMDGEAPIEVVAGAVGQRVRDMLRDDRALRVRPAKTLADRTVIEFDRVGRVGSIVRLQDAGLVVVDRERVSLTADWPEKLGIARELGDEYATEGRKRDQHRRGRDAYREHRAGKYKADRAPTEEEMDADPRRETRKKQRRVDVLIGHGMREDLAAREVFGADGAISDLSREPEPPPKLPPKRNGVYVHGPECACWWCADEGAA
jgi:hypothetical protein